MNERSRRVVLLIDYDNLQICASRDTPGRDLQLTPVVQLAQRYGTVILARAYAEWNLSTERLAVYKAGIEPAFAPVLRTESDRSGKSLADTVMVAEGMDMLWTLSPDVVVLATSDKDLIPLVRVAKQRGAYVVVLGSDFTAIPLREMADEHITYRQCITDATGRLATEAGPGRQPAALPEPSRRRRDRNGRERAAASAAAPAAAPAPQRAEPHRPEPQRAESPRAEPPRAEPPRAESPRPESPRPERDQAAAEPVPPVAAGESESQAGGRRRRRRGSRRRLERLGALGEAAAAGEPSNGAAPGATSAEVDEITPTTSAVDEAEAAVDEAEETTSTLVEPAPQVAEAAAEPAAPEAVEAPAPPRERRRRTRRTTTTAAAAETPAAAEPAPPSATEPEANHASAAASAAEAEAARPAGPGSAEAGGARPGGVEEGAEAAAPGAETPSQPADVPPQSADVLPAPEPASTNGEAPAAPPRARPRRVASASRGRTRRV